LSTPAVRYAAAAASDCGRHRTSNEDAFGFSVEHGVYLLCDGMGGAAAGEVASALAVDEMLRLLSSRAEAKFGAATLEGAVEGAIRAANEAIHSRAQRDPRLSGMGTTLVGLAAEGRRVIVFNVGDSRCYRLRHTGTERSGAGRSRLKQISLDHSLVAEQVRMGRMTPAEALRSPQRNVITRALGTESAVTPDLFELEAEAGDLFLLCSDGLTGELADARIESLLAADLLLDRLCARLVEAANQAGGRDNITCMLVRAESQ
jgi:protein phosphatase